jgi:hypothetical protein
MVEENHQTGLAGSAFDMCQTLPGKDLIWDTNDPFLFCIMDALFQ